MSSLIDPETQKPPGCPGSGAEVYTKDWKASPMARTSDDESSTPLDEYAYFAECRECGKGLWLNKQLDHTKTLRLYYPEHIPKDYT